MLKIPRPPLKGLARRAALLSLLLLGACAGAERERASRGEALPESALSGEPDRGSCKPFFVSSMRERGEAEPRHSCWNRLWEVPAAIVVVPLALAMIACPVWVPVLLLK